MRAAKDLERFRQLPEEEQEEVQAAIRAAGLFLGPDGRVHPMRRT